MRHWTALLLVGAFSCFASIEESKSWRSNGIETIQNSILFRIVRNERTGICKVTEVKSVTSKTIPFKDSDDLNSHLETFCKGLRVQFTKRRQGIPPRFVNQRSKRQVGTSRKRYRGQTQTQYIAFNRGNQTEKAGTAEAIATPDVSRATVSGIQGMGQAQSQSGVDEPCDEYCGGRYPGAYGTYPDSRRPGEYPQGSYSSQAGAYPSGPQGSTGGSTLYPTTSQGARPGDYQPGSGQHPIRPDTGYSSFGPGGVQDSSRPGGHIQSPGVVSPGLGGQDTPSGPRRPGDIGYPGSPGSGVTAGGVSEPGRGPPGAINSGGIPEGHSLGPGGYPFRPDTAQHGQYPQSGQPSYPTATGVSGGTQGRPGDSKHQAGGYPGEYGTNGQRPGAGLPGDYSSTHGGYPTQYGSGPGTSTTGIGSGIHGQYPGSSTGTSAGRADISPLSPGTGVYPPRGPGTIPDTTGSSRVPAHSPGSSDLGAPGRVGPIPGAMGGIGTGGFPSGTPSGTNGYLQPSGGTGAYPAQPGGSGAYPAQPGGSGAYPAQLGGPGAYPQQPGGSGTYPAQLGGPGAYPTQAGGPGAYPQQPGGSGTYPTQAGGPSAYPQQPGGSGTYPTQAGGPGTYPQQPGGSGTYPQQPGGSGTYPQQPGGSGTYPTQSGGPSVYPHQPGGSGAYPQQSGGPGAYPHQPGGPGAYPTQAGGPGAYSTQAGGSGAYPQQPGGSGAYPTTPGMSTGPSVHPSTTYPAGPSIQTGVTNARPGSFSPSPEQIRPGSSGGYPGGLGTFPEGSGGPSKGTSGIPGGLGSYPTGTGSTQGGSGVYPGGLSTDSNKGSYPSSFGPVRGPTEQTGVHPGGTGTYPGSQGGFPGGNIGTGSFPTGASQHPGGTGTYPTSLSQQPIGPGTYPTGVSQQPSYTGAFPTQGGSQSHPGGASPYPDTSRRPGAYLPGSSSHPGGNAAYPDASGRPGVYPPGIGTHPGGTASYPGASGRPETYPGGGLPSTGGAGFPSSHRDPGSYPGTYPGAPGSHTTYPGGEGVYNNGRDTAVPHSGSPSATGLYPSQPGSAQPGVYPGTTGSRPGLSNGAYPGDTQIGSGSLPGTGPYPGASGSPGSYPGSPSSLGAYPGTPGYSGATGTQPGGSSPGSYIPSDLTSQTPGASCPNLNCATGEGDAGETQAQSSVHYEGNETQALASSQGKVGSGVAQTQVSGTYTGSGSFNAQAQTSDNQKSAQSQIQGSGQGATSTAQGRAGKAQTQAQVQVATETGATQAESQTNGGAFGTNTQVQAGTEGGLADAQSRGTGSTSSQAQIGFLPYDGSNDNQKTPFKGGGTASAQSSGISGQSQSQIQGTFKYGISYTGAAQAGSGISKDTPFPKLSIPGSLYNTTNLSKKNGTIAARKEVANSQLEGNKHNETSENYPPGEKDVVRTSSSQNSPSVTNLGNQQIPGSRNGHTAMGDFEEDYEEDDYSEDDEDEESVPPMLATRSRGNIFTTYTTTSSTTVKPTVQVTHTSPTTQTQQIILARDDKHDTLVIQDSTPHMKKGDVFAAGQEVPGSGGYKVPTGFRGRVTSVAGDKTEASAPHGGQAQTQTVVISPGSGKLQVEQPRNQQALNTKESYRKSFQSAKPPYNPNPRYPFTSGQNSLHRPEEEKPYDSFVTVTNSVTGQLKTGQKDEEKKYAHTYYTKSSTCGYFTFTCTVVSGSNGRTKICKPRPQTNPDGSPCF